MGLFIRGSRAHALHHYGSLGLAASGHFGCLGGILGRFSGFAMFWEIGLFGIRDRNRQAWKAANSAIGRKGTRRR
jgi:hypothetical protein